ncbi:hypothetical protein B0H17DRAFT_1174754 [Mycena rosella]|uniref:MYND-type domain-containing protein n=1 Tax=Mycena rosella TaxID=1033263 RepID=A0AAD7M9J4_MYCRO|nr:hypothetical protein B0H17DRAFT_1174754 [Mycena rosella]
MEQSRPRRSKKAKVTARGGQDKVCVVCSAEQKNQSEKFRVCSGCKDKLGIRRYFCSRACQRTDWKTHRDVCGSMDFWDYPHTPLLDAPADFARSAALRSQIALIGASPEVLYTVAPTTDDALRLEIKDKMLNVSFRRVRDKAFTTCDPKSIAILAQTLVGAVEAQALDPDARVENVYKQLEDEYGFPGTDIAAVVAELEPGALERLHQEDMARHPSGFWKALARPID